ncbi:MAG: SCO family protein [Caulobacteraceae bacterium]
MRLQFLPWAFGVLLLLPSAAGASLTPAQSALAEVEPPPHARAPLEIAFLDDRGRPTTLGEALEGKPGLLIFADWRCANLCGPALALTRVGLERSGLSAGRDFRLVAIGLDPAQGPTDARAMRQREIASDAAMNQVSVFLSGSPSAIRTATSAFGYRYVRDPTTGQFAHLADAFVLAPDGKLTDVLSEIDLTGPELRDALIEAKSSEARSSFDPIRILCHGFSTASGLWNKDAEQGIWAAVGAFFVLAVLGVIGLGTRRKGRS